MLFVYSFLLSIGFVLMLPLFLLRREKYASGFNQRLGNYPKFQHDDRKVIWLHCVSVGETNAARPLVDALLTNFTRHRVIISTTTQTGQELSKKLFGDRVDAIIYFPFDWKFSVRRALENYRPSLVLLMETEIWPRFIHEAKASGARVAIVNGRLSDRSLRRYSRVGSFVSTVLNQLDLALMQSEPDAKRIEELGIAKDRIAVTGNLKFEQDVTSSENELTGQFRRRFGIDGEKKLIVAASTHEPEERLVIESLEGILGYSCRILIAPRHPERFDDVARLLADSSYSFVRRSEPETAGDLSAEIVLLDSIGELRAAYPLADIVFVGGSLIPHGGQSVLEPAAASKPIVTGPYTHNFESVMKEFRENKAVIQTPEAPDDFQVSERLYEAFTDLLDDPEKATQLGANAAAVMLRAKKGATEATIEQLRHIISE